MSNAFGQRGRNKRMIFSIHFDANSEEFNQLVQIGYLNLVGHPFVHPPQAHVASLLQPHLSIVDFLDSPHMQPIDDSWENIPANPSSDIVHWPNVSLPPPPIHHMPLVASVASHAHSVQVSRNYKAFPIEPQLDRGKQTAISLSSYSSETSSYTVKTRLGEPENNERIFFFDVMHLEMSKVEENKSVDARYQIYKICRTETKC
jgi:hypothetical protein